MQEKCFFSAFFHFYLHIPKNFCNFARKIKTNTHMKKKFFYGAALLAAITLSACGGKDSSESSTADSESATVAENNEFGDFADEVFPEYPASDPRYIYPENAKLKKLSSGNFYKNNLTLYICEANGKYGVVDEWKRVIIPVEYDAIKQVVGNSCYYYIQKDSLWGIIDQDGEFCLPPVLTSIKYNAKNWTYTLTEQNGETRTISSDRYNSDYKREAANLAVDYHWGNGFFFGVDSIPPKKVLVDDYYTTGKFTNGLMPVYDKNKKKVGFLNTKGEWAIPQTISCKEMYYMYEPAFSGGYLVLDKEASDFTHFYEIYDQKGKLLWTQKYRISETTHSLSDYVDGGFALMRLRTGNGYKATEQWKYVSPTGKEIFPEVYGGKQYGETNGDPNSYIRPMRNGMVAFADFSSYDTRWGFFDKKGKVIVRGKYAKVHDFQDGLAAVQMPQNGENPNKWGFIDKTGEMVIAPRFSNEPSDFSEGLAVVEKSNGMKVYINKQGEVVSPEANDALPFLNGTAFIKMCYEGYLPSYMAIDHSFQIVNSFLPEETFSSYNVDRLKKALTSPKRAAEVLFYYTNYNFHMYNSRGDDYFIYCDDEFTVNAVSDGIVHVQYGPYHNRIDAFCDLTGNIIFYLERNEF